MNRFVRPPRTARTGATPTPEPVSRRDERPGLPAGPVADDPNPIDDPILSERLTLIEFSWAGQAGIQPVILVARTLLH